jgi:hypothetical protein
MSDPKLAAPSPARGQLEHTEIPHAASSPSSVSAVRVLDRGEAGESEPRPTPADGPYARILAAFDAARQFLAPDVPRGPDSNGWEKQ